MRDKIIKGLQKLGKSRYWLAQEAGIKKQNLYTWLDGRNTLSEEGQRKVCTVMCAHGIQCKPWYALIRTIDGVQTFYFSSLDEIAEYMRKDFIFVPDGPEENVFYESFCVIRGDRPVGGTEICRVYAEEVDGKYTFSFDFNR